MSDLTKKVRFQTGEEKDGNTDFCDNTDNVMIYDNYEKKTTNNYDLRQPPKLQDDTTKDQQQTPPVNESSRNRNHLRAAVVCLCLLCLLLLTAVIVLLVLSSQDKSNWIMERNQLREDNANLTSERDHLQALNNNLAEEIDELQNQIDHYSQQGWVYFSSSFYYISSDEIKKTWQDSRNDCLQRGADLVVINSKEEQDFMNQYKKTMWIGLTYREREGTWKWVDGTPMTTSFWHSGQPKSYKGRNEDCVETIFYRDENSWNDALCGNENSWICEKKMSL